MDAEHQVTLILLSSDLIKQVVQCFLRERVVKEEKAFETIAFYGQTRYYFVVLSVCTM